jgi:WhiB family redox-sensing transcriptional regulator
MQHAACRGSEVDFYSPHRADIDKAKAVCARCSVRQECLTYAVEHGEYGVWGGFDDAERNFVEDVAVSSRCLRCNEVTVPLGDYDLCLSCGTKLFR